VSLVLETPSGSITVPGATLLAVAVAAAERVDGIRVLRRRGIDLDERLVRLSVSARRGEPLAGLGEQAQREVHDCLQSMSGIDARVELTIAELA
jgi:hypothetical protein